MDAGQDGIEHYFYPSVDGKSRNERMAVWRRFRDRGVPIVPTLVTLFETTFPSADRLRAIANDDEGRIDPRRRYLSKFLARDWREQAAEASDRRSAALKKIWEEVIRRDPREMHEAGMDILAGSDVAAINVYPGFSLHEEMMLLVREIGLTPAEVLDRATRRSASFLGLGDTVGTFERGKVADLVLLDGDPLQDITKALERLKAAVKAAADHTVDDWGRTSKQP